MAATTLLFLPSFYFACCFQEYVPMSTKKKKVYPVFGNKLFTFRRVPHIIYRKWMISTSRYYYYIIKTLSPLDKGVLRSALERRHKFVFLIFAPNKSRYISLFNEHLEHLLYIELVASDTSILKEFNYALHDSTPIVLFPKELSCCCTLIDGNGLSRIDCVAHAIHPALK